MTFHVLKLEGLRGSDIPDLVSGFVSYVLDRLMYDLVESRDPSAGFLPDKVTCDVPESNHSLGRDELSARDDGIRLGAASHRQHRGLLRYRQCISIQTQSTPVRSSR